MNKSTNTEARETLRQMLADWDVATDEQRAEAQAKASAAASGHPAVGSRLARGRYASGREAVRTVLRSSAGEPWNRPTSASIECPHFVGCEHDLD